MSSKNHILILSNNGWDSFFVSKSKNIRENIEQLLFDVYFSQGRVVKKVRVYNEIIHEYQTVYGIK